ncbi:MAG: hypothetical protein APF84_02180 [Gracilibacter sp. BRH_c7a]|nr:MAG: hypothetical protein APF84_02180 [Gracilibacter sp. BRH_c7a]
MMNQDTLAPHETLELHEILRFKQTEIKKIKANMALVEDEKLRSYMQDCLESSVSFINELGKLSEKSSMEIGGV